MKVNSINLQGMQLMARKQNFFQRLEIFESGMSSITHTYLRSIISPAGREVIVEDSFTGEKRNMLMFASNNYLDLANHPHVKSRVESAIAEYGC